MNMGYMNPHPPGGKDTGQLCGGLASERGKPSFTLGAVGPLRQDRRRRCIRTLENSYEDAIKVYQRLAGTKKHGFNWWFGRSSRRNASKPRKIIKRNGNN